MSDAARIGDEIKSRWYEKLTAARLFMDGRSTASGVLIEIAAQHPLRDGVSPGPEFSCRLDRGRELFLHFSASGRPVEIYVPGSRHRFRGRADDISLSLAGREYLVTAGIPSRAIHGDDLNKQYKGEAGVYGSADECFVTSSYFRDSPQFGVLASVVSPAQMLRKTLHYIEFGVLPLNYTAPIIDSFHNYLDELFEQIPYVLLVDSSLQDPTSIEAQRLRNDRMPKTD
jgi:hypothetical protein